MVTRVNGFSGMDIDSMVKSMMAAKRVPLDKLSQDKQLLQWRREGYREFSASLYDFSANKLGIKYGTTSALNANKAVTSGNTDAVKAVATATANNIDMSVEVTQLATRTTLEMKNGLGQGYTGATSLSQLEGVEFSQLSPKGQSDYMNKGFFININGETFTDKDGKSLFNGLTSISTVIATINNNAKANAIASFDQITGKLSIASKTSGKQLDGTDVPLTIDTPAGKDSLLSLFAPRSAVTSVTTVGTAITDPSKTLSNLQTQLDGTTEDIASALKYKFTVNNEKFVFNGSASIQSVVDEINSRTAANVTADFTGGKLTLTGNTGAEVKLGGDAFDLLKLFNGTTPLSADPNTYKVTSGDNAQVKINNVVMTNVTSNTYTINGVELTLQGLTNGTPTVIKTQSDPDKALESIKGFVDDYNNLIKTLNAKVDEVLYRDFKPLTDEQKKDMKDEEVKAWTEKARSGLFKNNDIISNVLSEMRLVISNKLGPLSELGITTGSYSENGKLIIKDEFKLKTALSTNPQLALDIFHGPANLPKEGIFDKLTDKITSAIQQISDRAGTNRYSTDLSSSFKEESIMGKKMKEYNSRIALMTTNLNNWEARYYKQFTAMETAMAKLQSQSSSLFSTGK